MNKIIESSVEEILKGPQTDTQRQQQDLDPEDFDMAAAISDAHDDPC